MAVSRSQPRWSFVAINLHRSPRLRHIFAARRLPHGRKRRNLEKPARMRRRVVPIRLHPRASMRYDPPLTGRYSRSTLTAGEESMRTLIAVGIGLLLLPVAHAQEQGWGAKFFQGEVNHNFGNVPWGAQLTHKFTITNIYNVP